jgi:CheY-like chemotaxis protein
MPHLLLVIDDDNMVRESLRFILRRRGYQVIVAENGPAGLMAARDNPVDGVLLDYHMPVMNGAVVCRSLMAYGVERGRPLPVWMMTGARTHALAKAAAEAGAIVLFSKPFDIPELHRHLEARLSPVAAAVKVEPGVVQAANI